MSKRKIDQIEWGGRVAQCKDPEHDAEDEYGYPCCPSCMSVTGFRTFRYEATDDRVRELERRVFWLERKLARYP